MAKHGFGLISSALLLELKTGSGGPSPYPLPGSHNDSPCEQWGEAPICHTDGGYLVGVRLCRASHPNARGRSLDGVGCTSSGRAVMSTKPRPSSRPRNLTVSNPWIFEVWTVHVTPWCTVSQVCPTDFIKRSHGWLKMTRQQTDCAAAV